MFPVGDFNFVFCSLATVAATVGYAFTRKQNPMTPSVTPSPDPVSSSSSSGKTQETSPSQEGAARPQTARKESLKRKVPHDGFDEPTADDGYPHNLRHIYPYKRTRTPSSEPEQEADDKPATSPIFALVETKPEEPVSIEQEMENTVETKKVEETEEVPRVEEQASPAINSPRTPSPPPSVTSTAAIPETPASAAAPTSVIAGQTELKSTTNSPASPFLTRPNTPAGASFSRSAASTPFQSSGFAAFAGSASPFASVKKTSQASFRASLWNLDNDASSSTDSSASKNGLGLAFGETESQDVQNSQTSGSHAIVAATPSKSVNLMPSTLTTGEENEDVEQEIKGVKLFIKRGNKPFASGMVGHLKLLSDKKTLAERLLFRREPLWQVSMNVRLNAATRVVYDAEENVIRLALKEPVSPSTPAILEPVVYALKPGRACSKQDFKEFAESLLKNAQFKQPPPTVSVD
ncbi:hypothetical protein CC1G_04016 [Coprinopsis cinerea okayama7|uniref:RanBD1 domain-containing protein n=1 Tax=Coprinopsis cinerea (strain Okayama-7 / 130 / ATCC MYA-4618 / FGSC 9003) TaxID=240176 RepID=A8N8G9_COPC7|nr:hypothetical protein CC1G_04016 [Coprinopsis cinerea okayama7\|eukprot:XP_001831125.2 hypothetical protein CC1G_04016 [Coprinopsis cinerea okayama7\